MSTDYLPSRYTYQNSSIISLRIDVVPKTLFPSSLGPRLSFDPLTRSPGSPLVVHPVLVLHLVLVIHPDLLGLVGLELNRISSLIPIENET